MTSWFTIRGTSANFSASPPSTITSKVVDRDGREIESSDRPIGESEVRKGLDIRDAGPLFLPVNHRFEIGDCLAYGFKTKLIVSVALMEAFRSHGIRLHHDLYAAELTVIDSVSKRARGEYRVLWPLLFPEVLDLNRSKYECFFGTKVIRSVTRWAFKDSITTSTDLFQCESYEWVASEAVADVIRSGNFRGVALKRIDVIK